MSGAAADLAPDLSAAIGALQAACGRCRARVDSAGIGPALACITIGPGHANAWLSGDAVPLRGTGINGGDVDSAFAALVGAAARSDGRPYTLDEINRTFGIGDRT